MKVVFSVILVFLLGLTVLAGKMMPPPPGGERIHLVWASDNNPVRQAQVDLFNKLNPDLYLTIDTDNADQQKVIVQSIGGVGPDIFSSFGEFALAAYVNSGIAMDVTDHFASKGIDVEKMVWPAGIPSSKIGGRTYAFPCNINANAIWFNKEIFDAEGVPYPKPDWTWEDLIATAKRMTKRDARGKPTRFGLYYDFDWNSLLLQHGGRAFSEDGTECTIDSPEAIEAFTLAHDLIYKYNVTPSPVQVASISTQGGWGSGDITFFMGGRVAMAWGGRWWLNLMRKDPKSPRCGVVPLPHVRVNTQIGGARVAMVNSRSKHPKEALRFLEFLASREYNELINDQADALAPVMKYCEGPKFDLNPAYPEETYNSIWRDAIKNSTTEPVSKFVQGSELAPLNTQLDLIKSNIKPVKDALRDAKIQMDERILRTARIRPSLGKLWTELKGAQP
ncbi:MAG: ABC transporter substrate-binding protein [Fimbriimonas sp.]